MARAIGVDLGTTHSLVAHVDGRNRPRVLDVDGGPLLASAVWYGPGGAVEVGRAARDAAPARAADTVLSVKRLMGRGAADVPAADRGAVPAADGDGAVVRLRAGGRTVTPVEVSAELLRVLRGRAAEALGGPPGPCVITVPAFFDDAQRQATRDAGRLAGLEVVRLLAEPTAAALAYGLDQRVEGTYAVYDLGGGTFDVSILRLEGGVFEVLATAGDTHLGGDDLDRAVAAAWGPPDPAGLALARHLRERLSTEEAVSGELRGRPVHLDRAALERLVAPIVERTTAPCRDALRQARVERLDGVVLVGGATRTPLVRRHVREVFGQEPLVDLDPDTVVALGAAVQADLLDRGGRDDVLLLDVVPLTLGIETMGGVVEPLVPRNSTIPASATEVFTTHADGQTGIVVHVVQGERELAQDCRSLARFTLKGIPRMPAGVPEVEIAFAVDADGILRVSARERVSGASMRVVVRPAHGLTEAEVEAMLVESLAHAEADVRERFLREARVEAERTIGILAAAVREDAALLAPGELDALDARVQGLRRAMAGDDLAAVKAWLDSLDEAARAFVERRADAHVARALAGRRVEDV